MNIRDMFLNDIDRVINSVIKVTQYDEESLKQELSEYIITTELKKHFKIFFERYSMSIEVSTNNIGVWISGFYGSGKSHFLKILSYILENKKVCGKRAIEYFENKFEDSVTYINAKKCANIPTETILFNIDIEGGIYKDKTAILKVFAKVFYNHIGYYGDDLKIVKLEKFIKSQDKYDNFTKVFEQISNNKWIKVRNNFSFFEDSIVETLKQVLDISEVSARNWFNGEETSEISIKQLVEDINEYVINREKNFRLLFMVDELGQYINNDVNMKINLQSIVEQIGAVCNGKVWVVVTSQEAVKSFLNNYKVDFSGIVSRFNIILNLTSSSADEVIKKRILKKNNNAIKILRKVYKDEYAVLKNLLDLKFYRDEFDYVDTYPFVPYQFIIIQKVFDAIRTYGIASKHQSSGERSLIKCYQIVAQKVKNNTEKSLVPFYYFYDALADVFDDNIRSIVDSCKNDSNIYEEDVNVLKLLYLLKYINDIPPNVDNISNLMVNNIRIDKIKLRENIKYSLERLIHFNYVLRVGDKYNFLTDEEQEIAKDIKGIDISSYDIVTSIATTVFEEIYPFKKFKYNKYNFTYEKFIDEVIKGSSIYGIGLRIVTIAGSLFGASEQKFKMDSYLNKEAIVVLSDKIPYYKELEQAMKIQRYVKQRNLSSQLVKKYKNEAKELENIAKEYIEKSILEAEFYVHGKKIYIKNGTAKDKLDTVLKSLIDSVYSKLCIITNFYNNNNDILKILNNNIDNIRESNKNALMEISQWLEVQEQKMAITSMGDIHKRYGNIPYGWRSIDIACLVAALISQQKIEIKYEDTLIDSGDYKLVDYLLKKSDVDKAIIIRNIPIDEELVRRSTSFLRNYLGAVNLSHNIEELTDFIITYFEKKQNYYNELLKQYDNYEYPEKNVLISASNLISDILSNRENKLSLLSTIIEKQNDLLDMSEDTEEIETFFRVQRTTFDEAKCRGQEYEKEYDYFDDKTLEILKNIKTILSMKRPYSRIKELRNLIQEVSETYEKLLTMKKNEVKNIVQCLEESSNDESYDFFKRKKEEIEKAKFIVDLDAMITKLLNYRNIPIIELIPTKSLQSKDDIDNYVEDIRQKLYKSLKNNSIRKN